MRFSIKWLPLRQRWRLEYRKGKRCRVNFKTKALAEAERDRVKLEVDQSGSAWIALTPAERNELMSVAMEIKRAGLTLPQVWSAHKKGTVPGGAPAITKPCSVVRSEFLAVKENAGRAGHYVASLRQIIAAFCRGREMVPMSRLTLEEVEAFVNGYALASRSTIRSRLASWFKFAVRRHYCATNLCALLEPAQAMPRIPATLTNAQTQQALEWLAVHPRAWAWFILSNFAGLRPEEAQQTAPDMMNFKEGWIRVEAQTTKVRERRVVYPLPGVMAALKIALRRGAELPLTRKQLQKERIKLRAHLGFKAWPVDCTRHTAASNWLAASENAAAVAANLGHSEKILHARYKALKTKVEAAAFWALIAREAVAR